MAIGLRPKLKTVYEKSRAITPLHTSGPIAITSDGTKVFTCVAENVLLTEVASGKQLASFQGDTQSITALCITPSDSHLFLFTSAQSLRIFEIPSSFIGQSVSPSRVLARGHDAPVHVCAVDPTSTYLASGSADGVVKVWDVARGYATHIFKGHGGAVSALTFNFVRSPSVTQERVLQLVTASVDTRIRIFDLSSILAKDKGAFAPIATLEGHVSVPRSLAITEDGKWMLSGGRDSVVLIWDMSATSMADSSKRGSKNKTRGFSPTLVKTIPTLERVEAIGIIESEEDHTNLAAGAIDLSFFTAGEKGMVKVWQAKDSKLLYSLGEECETDQEEQRQIMSAIYVPSISTVVSVHADQNILFHSLDTRSLTRQLIGFNDEIVDAVFLSPHIQSPESASTDSHIAFATNSSLIRVYSTSGLDARLLSGHTDIVLCLDRGAKGQVLASGSKDRIARIWAFAQNDASTFNGASVNQQWGCVALCEGHTESIGAIAMSRTIEDDQSHPRFMFTGSQDRTIKMWDLSEVPLSYGGQVQKCRSLTTQKAHEKDINSLDVAPNDKLLASGSQDRTVKIYEIDYSPRTDHKAAHGEIKLLGTCKGHKRGVWSVQFGRTERILATGSGDKTIKLWNLKDYSCIKTFEGHTNSVLRVDFINLDLQLVSTASDGLLKLWNIREEECIATMDNHEDKVWALAISADEKIIVSGAADSVVTFWEDCSEEREKDRESKREELILKEQAFMNYLSLNDYRKAIQLALAMQQPGRLLNLFKTIRSSSELETLESDKTVSLTGKSEVDEVLRTLAGSELARLLRYVRDWNANAKTSAVAQGILHAIMKLRSVDDIMKVFGDEAQETALITDASTTAVDTKKRSVGDTSFKELVDGLIPYTERHLSRLDKLVQDSYIVDYILSEMDDGMFDGGEHNAMDIDKI